MNLQNAAWLVAIAGGGGLAGWLAGARSKLGAIRQRRRDRRLRTWNGYIDKGMIASWYVCSVEEATTPTARVVLEVRGRDGKPDVNRAYALRQHVKADGMLARVPTPAEYEFLGDLRKHRGYGRGSEAKPVH